MTDNKQTNADIEPLLNEMLLTLAAFCQANNKERIEYAASISNGKINQRTYKLTFVRTDDKGKEISDRLG